MRALMEDPAERGRRPGLSRRLAARRASLARVEGAGGDCLPSRLLPGVLAALAVLILDQVTKLWLLFVFDIGHRGAVKITPFFDLVLAWNVGISFGWFQNDSQFAQIVLMVIKAVAGGVFAICLGPCRPPIATLALRPIVGGDVGNG